MSTPRLSNSTAHLLLPMDAWTLALVYWRIYKRRAEQLCLDLQERV